MMTLNPHFEQYDAIFGDDPAAYLEFLEALQSSMEKARHTLSEAAQTEDWNVISATRHSLKPTMTLLGAGPINGLLEDWRPTMSALDPVPLQQALDIVLSAIAQKKKALS